MPNDIRQYPVPMVFKTILMKNSNGELLIRGKGFTKRIWFLQGKVEFAKSDVPRERLGNVLVIKGFLDRERMQQINFSHEGESYEKVGQRLVRAGIVPEKELYNCLAAQCRLIAAASFSLKEGEWEFFRGIPAIPGERGYHLGLPRLIMEGVKNIVDFSFYRNMFLHYILNVDRMQDSLKKQLSPFSLQFYKSVMLISGQPTKNILAILAISEDIFWREVVMFYLLNAFEFVEAGHLSSDTETFIVSQIAKQKRQKTQPPVMRAVPIQKKTAEPPLPWVQKKSAKADETIPFESFPPADKSGTMPSHPEAAKDPKALFIKAKSHYQEKEYREAAKLLYMITRDPSAPASYFFLLALCQAHLPEMRKQAEQSLRIVAGKEPWNADPFYYLGELYRSEGMMQLAENAFVQALEINKDHTLANRRYREIEGRRKRGFFSTSRKK